MGSIRLIAIGRAANGEPYTVESATAICTVVCMGLVDQPCGAVIGTVTVAADDNTAGGVSHGLCQACYDKQMAQIAEMFKDKKS